MQYTATDIDALSELVADNAQYSAEEYKRPDSPSFIFRDERGSEPSDILWGRDLALDFEEWKAKQEQREQYLSGELMPAFVQGLDYILATMDQIEEWIANPTGNRKPVMVKRDADGVLQEWSHPNEAETEAFIERQESREAANWLVNWHKKIKNANQELMADCLRKGIAKLADVLDDPEFGPYALATHRAAKEVFKDAPKKVDGVYYINPDGKKVRARDGLNYNTAKEGYKLRHGIEDQLVTMDRVQYEGELTSRYIIGTRKASDKTPSGFYDPEPIKGDYGYVPRACTLIRVPESKVMPDEHCYRLTVRELERAIIAGANLVESDIEAFADSFDDTDECFDTREGGISFDNSCDFRTLGDLDEQEQWLYWVFVSAGMEMASQALLVAECSDIARFLPGLDGACLKLATDEDVTEDEEIALNMLEKAREDDLIELEKTGRIQWSRFDFLRSLE